jgi:hypothetical protein
VANREKFLVAAAQTELSGDQLSMDKFSERWKDTSKEAMFEYRLQCHVEQTAGSVSGPYMSTATLSPEPPQVGVCTRAHTPTHCRTQTLTDIGREVRELRGENRVLLAVMVTMLFILLFVIFYQRSTYQALAQRIDNRSCATARL